MSIRSRHAPAPYRDPETDEIPDVLVEPSADGRFRVFQRRVLVAVLDDRADASGYARRLFEGSLP